MPWPLVNAYVPKGQSMADKWWLEGVLVLRSPVTTTTMLLSQSNGVARNPVVLPPLDPGCQSLASVEEKRHVETAASADLSGGAGHLGVAGGAPGRSTTGASGSP